MNTGCVVKGTTNDEGAYWMDASKYIFKWDLVPPLYGFCYALILLVGTIMALFKLFDLVIEMSVCIMFLPVTALSNIVSGGWGEMFSNNVKELFKTCGAIFLQIFMVCFAIGIYRELVTEVYRNGGIVDQVLSNQWYSWTTGWIKLLFSTALILCMFWFMLNGSDALTKFMGVDTGIGSSAAAGFALAKLGYRPIPIFNGTDPPIGTISTTNNQIIKPLLIWGAFELKNIKLKNDAPPVFLLDQNRLNRYKINNGIFDNSWDIYDGDLPSPKYLLENGINKIIVRSNFQAKDLRKILYKWQKNNIKIFFTNGYEEPKEVKLKKFNI